ncbi:hypothetical protein KIN20_011692 [Parelaphostrongylus tenuis]|uniref:Uncharacterized protein n=1 Tax=Parelaphostrongylus tenuis TaxID=148309 RepID=A0AAD5MVE2_PARTN|nr:hypothetical protein KIN20_011692 [Parelaphostrongylus tenuis]
MPINENNACICKNSYDYKRGAETCLPYYYPRCSHIEEMDEQPIQYEQNCQDICFRGPEKRVSPLFQLALEIERLQSDCSTSVF